MSNFWGAVHSSFQASVTDKNAKQLKLPEILPLKEYQYE